MNSYVKLLEEDRRLAILLMLVDAPQYKLNHFLVQTALETFGHTVSTDRLTGDLAWLEEQGLLNTEAHGRLTVATITARGMDVARGRATHPGVKRPQP